MQLLKLQDNESVFLLNLKLARAKTLQALKNFGRNTGLGLKTAGTLLIRAPLELYRVIHAFLKKLRHKIGYASKPVAISTELSDYLSRTDSTFSSLPYIYQRLYLLEPLEDELFFIERKAIFDEINLALENWINNGYSPLALIGEKGAGATTVFSVYQNRSNGYTIYRIRSSRQIYDESVFFEQMAREIGMKPASHFESIKEYLVNLPGRSIIILEDLQRYYLRTVNGFAVLKKIFELISTTNQNILWLCSCTIYAWNYLDRVVSISSYFGFTIRLDDIDDEGILKVIEQRHRISGYKIRYVPNKLQQNNRKFLRLSEEEQQEFLSNSYRASLARFSRGNISLALVHWIRSTQAIEDKTVVISSIYEPDYSFFESLPVDCILALYMILIHDGLTEEHLSRILSRSDEELRIILFRLFDDGILDRNNGIYFINTLIYRQLVNFLRLKNYLH